MFLLKIFISLLSLRFLEGLTIDSHYMASRPKQQVDVLFQDKANQASAQLENLDQAIYDDYVKPLYKYGYSVFDPYTLDVKSQWEQRDGDTVRGAYSMLEADGSMRIVEYMSDKDIGFRAIVKKIPNYLGLDRTLPNKISPFQYTPSPARIYRPQEKPSSLSSPPPSNIVRPRDKPSSNGVALQHASKSFPAQFAEYTARATSNPQDPLHKYVSEIKGSRSRQNYEQKENRHVEYDNGQNIIPTLITKR